MRDYCRRYRNTEPERLPRRLRLPYAYLLANLYAYTPREIAAFFRISTSSAYRLVSDARFFHNRSPQQRDEENRIARYILYNAQWRG